MRVKIAEHLGVFVLLVAAAIYYSIFQPQILLNGGYGLDGAEYYRVYSIVAGLGGDLAGFPFCQRVGTAYVAFALGLDSPIQAFRLVNTFFGLVFSYAIYLIGLRAGFSRHLALTGVLISLLVLPAPLRVAPFFPVYTDPAFLSLLALAFLALLCRHSSLALLVLVIAFPFREVAIYLAPVFLVFAIVLEGGSRRLFIALLGAIAAMLIIKFLISLHFHCEGGQLRTALSWLRRALTDPQRLLACVASISLSAAPAVYLARLTSLNDVEKISMLGLLVACGLTLVGGTDTTRIFFSFFPIYVLAILAAMRVMGPWFTAVSLLGYAIVNRVGMRILEPQGGLPARDESGLYWQIPDQGRPEVALMILAVWLLLFWGFGSPRRRS